MNHQTQEASRKFAQVSLSAEFAADVRAQAKASDRSMAAQLEHWAKLAKAIETVIPATTLMELKSGKDAGEVLSRVGAYLYSQNPALLKAKLATAKSPIFGISEADPEVAIRKDPDGTITHGRFNADGDFIPVQSPAESEPHEKRKTNTRVDSTNKPRPAAPGPRAQASSSRVAAHA